MLMSDNPYFQLLSDRIDEHFDIEAEGMTPTQWLGENTTIKDRAFTVGRYPFQRALIDDTSRKSVTVKPSQVGVSELYQRVALMMLKRARHRKGIYAYPDDDMRKKNVQTRMLPLSSQPVFAVPVGEKWVRSIVLIQIGTSYLYVTGSKTGDATSTDADFVFLDEYDLHDMEVAALFKSRLQNSDWKIERYFSTPTYTQFGVDALFIDSDQNYYLIKCDHCNHWQYPTFNERFIKLTNLPEVDSLLELSQDMVERYGIDVAGSYVRCERCLNKLDLGREDNRNWVSKYPHRTFRGWRVNPFSTDRRPPSDIIPELFDYKRRGFIRGFLNSVLGEPEDSSSKRIQEADVRACFGTPSVATEEVGKQVYVGGDMGHTCHLVWGQKGQTETEVNVLGMEQVPIGHLRQWIAEKRSRYGELSFSGMVDRHPESQVAQDIWDITQGSVIPGEYRGMKEMNLIMVPGDDEKVHYAQINRTIHLDQVAAIFLAKRIKLNGYGLLMQEIVDQLRNMIRMEEPEKEAVWEKIDPNDHFFHALGFMLSSMKIPRFTEIKVGPVLSLLGFEMAPTTGLMGDFKGFVRARIADKSPLF